MSVNRTRAERQRERYVRYRRRVLADPKVRESYEEGLFPLKPRRATSARRERLSIHIPQTALARRPVERLMKMGRERDESVNYLVVKAILEFLEREEKEKAWPSSSRHQLRITRMPSGNSPAVSQPLRV